MIKYQQGDVVFIAINTDEWIVEERTTGKVMARIDGGGMFNEKETQQETKFIMALLKKFEIKKRIFSEYDHELKENSTDFKILTTYILLAAICAKKFQDNSNPKFLNTLLKLNDTICSQIDSINDVNNLSLIYYIINLELEYVRDLIRKTL